MSPAELSQFHFLRPWWLLGLTALPFVLIWWRRRRTQAGAWARVCDPALLPHVLIDDAAAGAKAAWGRWSGRLLVLAAALGLLALAGPAWVQLPQPVYKRQSALVIALDLSLSMDASDIKPSRLERARFKLADILQRRREGQTALVVYAADAFTVTPLTDDTATILSQVPVLTTDLMPAQGSDAAAAVKRARDLLVQAGIARGDILLITDGLREADVAAVRAALDGSGDRLSLLGAGTAEGAPIPTRTGGFIEDDRGRIVIARMDEARMRQLAQATGGIYTRLTVSDSDVNAIQALLKQAPLDTGTVKADLRSDRWREEGPWLLLPLLPLAALAFRRGALLALVALAALPVSRPASAFEWRDLWLRPDQQAAHLLKQGDARAAASRFEDRRWQAAADYRAGDYDKALQAIDRPLNADDHYNRGNAFARLGKFKEAVAAYDQALRLNPKDEDARYNRELLQKQMQKQGKQGQGQQNSGQDDRQKSGQQQGGKPGRDSKSGAAPDQSSKGDRNQPSAGKPGSEQQPPDRPQSAQRNQNQGNGQKKDQGDAGRRPEPSPDRRDAQKPPNQPNQPPGSQPQSPGTDQDRAADRSGHPRDNESAQADEQWLRRIPDDPGGLLRRKFYYQYSQRPDNHPSDQPW